MDRPRIKTLDVRVRLPYYDACEDFREGEDRDEVVERAVTQWLEGAEEVDPSSMSIALSNPEQTGSAPGPFYNKYTITITYRTRDTAAA